MALRHPVRTFGRESALFRSSASRVNKHLFRFKHFLTRFLLSKYLRDETDTVFDLTQSKRSAQSRTRAKHGRANPDQLTMYDYNTWNTIRVVLGVITFVLGVYAICRFYNKRVKARQQKDEQRMSQLANGAQSDRVSSVGNHSGYNHREKLTFI